MWLLTIILHRLTSMIHSDINMASILLFVNSLQHALSLYPMTSPPAALQPMHTDAFRHTSRQTPSHPTATAFTTPYLITHQPASQFPVSDIKVSPTSPLQQPVDPYSIPAHPQSSATSFTMESARARRRKSQHVDEGDPGRVSSFAQQA